MSITSKPEPSPKLHDNTANSFHKIYSEDYLSDEDTMSILSQQLNGSNVSMGNEPYHNTSTLLMQKQISPRLTRSPLTSSAFSLNQMPRTQISPNSSFRSYAREDNQTVRPMFAAPTPMTLTSSLGLNNFTLQLNDRERPQSTLFGANASVTNSSMLNNSFIEPSRARFFNRTQDNEASFYTAVNNSVNSGSLFFNNHNFRVPGRQKGLLSPLSVSSNSIYHHQQQPEQRQSIDTRQRVLSPTRFSTNNLTTVSNASWLSGGYFNQRQPVAEMPHNGLVIPTPLATVPTPMEESLSRSSSHSSGFESQNGRINSNTSRENSLCPDLAMDCQQRSLNTDITNGFQPIDSPCLGSFSPRPSTLNNTSINHFSNGTSCIWKQPSFTRRYNFSNNFSSRNSIDSFNLRKINEELPSIKRDDLLSQWKEGQTIS